MSKKIFYPVSPLALSAMTEMRQFDNVEQLEKWKDIQPLAILFDGDFVTEYKKFHERLSNGNIQPAIVKHMNPVNRKYVCNNCGSYGVPVINQFDLHFCNDTCAEEYYWEKGQEECDEERQRMGDTFIDRNYNND